MRVRWAAGGLAVAASALTGVLIGVYIDGLDRPKAEPPPSTWITRPSPSSSAPTTTTTSASTTDPIAAATTARATSSAPRTTVPPPPRGTTEEPTAESPTWTTTTTTKTRHTEWPCGPLNPFPPPRCDD